MSRYFDGSGNIRFLVERKSTRDAIVYIASLVSRAGLDVGEYEVEGLSVPFEVAYCNHRVRDGFESCKGAA